MAEELYNSIDDVKNYLQNKKLNEEYYNEDLEYNKRILETRKGLLNNIINVNNYNKKLIMTLISFIFGIIIVITSVVVLGNR